MRSLLFQRSGRAYPPRKSGPAVSPITWPALAVCGGHSRFRTLCTIFTLQKRSGVAFSTCATARNIRELEKSDKNGQLTAIKNFSDLNPASAREFKETNQHRVRRISVISGSKPIAPLARGKTQPAQTY